MSRTRRSLPLTLGCVMAISCGGDPDVKQSTSTEEPVASSPVVTEADSVSTDTTPPVRVPPVVPAPAGAGGAQQAAAADSIPLVPIQNIANGGVEPGTRVRVQGTCLGYSRILAGGPQPRTRSDWQLAADSVGLWVVGPYPPGCSGTVPSATPGIYDATVAVDTVPGLGGTPARRRFYLVRSPPL